MKQEQSTGLTSSLQENRQLISTLLGNSSDLVFHELTVGSQEQKALVIYIKGLIDQKFLYDQVYRVISEGLLSQVNAHPEQYRQHLESFTRDASTFGSISQVTSVEQTLSEILYGNTCVLFDQSAQGLVFGTTKEASRQQEEPPTEVLVRGPRIGFVEAISENTAIL